MLLNHFQNSVQMSFFTYFKTDNPIINSIIAMIGLSLMSYIVRILQDMNLENNILFYDWDVKKLFFRKNVVILEGKKSTCSYGYSKNMSVSSLYTYRFNAIWNYIITRVENNKTIYEITEISTGTSSNFPQEKTNEYKSDPFIVSQGYQFLIDKELNIYAITKINSEYEDIKNEDSSRTSAKIDKITIKLFSYKSDINTLIKFIDDITDKYLMKIQTVRFNKKFIYTLSNVEFEDCKYECWSECLFESSKNFNNLFFNGKCDIEKKIDFFVNNKQWYYEMGIPYTLGIGLHGPPGTGKTSLIKCIANKLNRHVVNLSLKLIKTKKQLDDFFFEDRYNTANAKESIGFDKKIIVIEDIDCIGNIVKDRNLVKQNTGVLDINKLFASSNININEALKANADQIDNITTDFKIVNNPTEVPITLDDILNLWDGLRETPGRVLIITSNHYNKLDPALIRPGRIDITLEMSNADHSIISDLYTHLTNERIDERSLKKIEPNLYSQAEIINMFLRCNKNAKLFLKILMSNKNKNKNKNL